MNKPHLRRSTIVLSLIAALSTALLGASAHTALSGHAAASRLAENIRLARALGLTDLSLFTEARYTRHLSMADLHTPFQDHPVSFEHFPTGTLVLPATLPVSGQLSADEKPLNTGKTQIRKEPGL